MLICILSAFRRPFRSSYVEIASARAAEDRPEQRESFAAAPIRIRILINSGIDSAPTGRQLGIMNGLMSVSKLRESKENALAFDRSSSCALRAHSERVERVLI